MIESFSLVSLPHEMLIVGQFYTLLSWSRKIAHLCIGPSYTALNLLRMYNSISA